MSVRPLALLPSSDALAQEIRREKNRIAQRQSRKKRARERQGSISETRTLEAIPNTPNSMLSRHNLEFHDVDNIICTGASAPQTTDQDQDDVFSGMTWQFQEPEDTLINELVQVPPPLHNVEPEQAPTTTTNPLFTQHDGTFPLASTSAGTPLHLATLAGHTEVIAIMLESGADTEAVDADGSTCLHIAAKQGSKDVLAHLLTNGARLDSVNSAGWTPLHVAAAAGHKDVVTGLLKAGADVNARILGRAGFGCGDT